MVDEGDGGGWWSAHHLPTFILRTSHGRSLRVTLVAQRAATLGASESVVVTGTLSRCLSWETPLREFGGR